MKFAKVVYWLAGIWGALALTPLHLIFAVLGGRICRGTPRPGFTSDWWEQGWRDRPFFGNSKRSSEIAADVIPRWRRNTELILRVLYALGYAARARFESGVSRDLNRRVVE
jgi:hypothetical protein